VLEQFFDSAIVRFVSTATLLITAIELVMSSAIGALWAIWIAFKSILPARPVRTAGPVEEDEMPKPPRIAQFLLELLAPVGWSEAVVGDFFELYERKFRRVAGKHGALLARVDYWWQVLRSAPGLLRIHRAPPRATAVPQDIAELRVAVADQMPAMADSVLQTLGDREA
jgi:hypothetical protein